MKNNPKPRSIKITLTLLWVKFILMIGIFTLGMYIVSKSSHENEILTTIQNLLYEKLDMYPPRRMRNGEYLFGVFLVPVIINSAILYSIHFRQSYVITIGLVGISIINFLSKSIPPIFLILAFGYLLLKSSRRYFHTYIYHKDDLLDEDLIQS